MDNKSIKILVIDDEQGILDGSQMILEDEGFVVVTASEGYQAVDVFEKERPQLVIVDVHLGYSKIHGLEVLKRIRAIDPKFECIVLSRVTDMESKNKAKALGVKYYLQKPLETEVWLSKILDMAASIKPKE